MVKKHCKNGLMLCVFLLAMFFLGRSIGAIAFGLHLQREMSIRETAGSALENTQALLSAENWGLGIRLGRNAAQRYGFLGQIKGI